MYKIYLNNNSLNLSFIKKAIFSLLLMCLISVALQAQIRIGAKAGISTTGISSDQLDDFFDDNTTGFYVGPSIEWLFNGRLGLDFSVMYSQKGIKFENEATQKAGYIEIPLNLKYLLPLRAHFKVFIGAGPYIDFKISGNDSFNVIMNDVQEQWETKSFGAGLNFNGGFEIYKYVEIGVNYSLGLSDNYKASNGNYSAKERVWSLFASLYF